MSDKDREKLSRLFPKYFELFTLPEGAHEEKIKVYRACRTGKCDRQSFLPTYEQQGFSYTDRDDPEDPGVYSLSTFEKPNHVKNFAAMTSEFHVPYKIAIGDTDPRYGLVQRTKERKPKSASHVDWWLYENATPEEAFEIISDFEEHLAEYRRGRDTPNEK